MDAGYFSKFNLNKIISINILKFLSSETAGDMNENKLSVQNK